MASHGMGHFGQDTPVAHFAALYFIILACVSANSNQILPKLPHLTVNPGSIADMAIKPVTKPV